MKPASAKTPSDNAVAWHQLPAGEVVQLLDANLEAGLTAEEARRRIERFGPNRLTPRKGRSEWMRLLLQFHTPLVYILLVAAVITAGLGAWIDSSVIFGVVFVNAIVGYVQESRAEKTISALARMVSAEATVCRDGHKQRVAADSLVPGDVVHLESGDRIPADLRLFHVRGLQVDESALTGESVPVAKHTDPLALATILPERHNLGFAGTLVTHGRAEGVVWGTGDRTELGRVASLVAETAELATPLTRKIAQFSSLMMWAILALAVGTFALGVIRGQPAFDMFMAAVALAVGAIPEGLPAAVTITLAIGVVRMARRRTIVRKLPAVEALGSTTVICSDKTGTLTQNQMTVREIFAGGHLYEVTGDGCQPRGDFMENGRAIEAPRRAPLLECLRAGLLCNDSELLRTGDGAWSFRGDPTEAALIVAAEKAGLAHAEHLTRHPRLDAIPFEAEHKFMATLHGGGERVIYKKGAVERLLERCTAELGPRGEPRALDREAAREAAEAMAARGLRVLAFARASAASDQRTVEPRHVAGGLTFLGLQGMIDPPRPEAIEAVRRCQRAGIAVKMITGDHVLTATAVARQIGLVDTGEAFALTGRELDRIDDAQLPEVATRTVVFARVAPEQKLRLVRALQARGHVVAMTGDGVNDAPALKQADIGVAMGLSGTDVARSAADIVLTDDNFASIEAAVEEGRNVFDNLTKFIIWTLPTNAGEALITLTAIACAMALPMLPVQVLWINLTTVLFLGLMLVFEPKERGLMARPPRDPNAALLTYPLLMRTGFVTLIMLAGAMSLFLWEQARGASLAEARTVVVNLIVAIETFYIFNCRSLLHSAWSIGLFSNPAAIFGALAMFAVQLLFTYAPVMQRAFHSAPLDASAWLRIFAVGLLASAAVGVEKWLRARAEDRAAAGPARSR